MCFANDIAKKTNKNHNRVMFDDDDNYYAHPTFVINSLADFIQLISTISMATDELTTGDAIVFRGHADSNYTLMPGLARLNLNENTEEKLINDFLTRRPDAFHGLSDFDMLAKMQHYGLPTRLLDFTSNPLVALYFACESLYQKDGRIICHYTFVQNDSSIYVNAICSAAVKKPFESNFYVDEYLCNESLPLIKYLKETYFYNATTVIRPKYWNQRIANQAGLFMIFPNDLLDLYKRVLIHIPEYGMDKALEHFSWGGTIDESIIREIANIEPIDCYKEAGTLILTDEAFRQMARSYRTEEERALFITNISNRFKMMPELKELSKRMISEQFCSIIIEGKNKKKILRDLSYIGIGADFIYPELEYTAKEIKRQYE